MAALLVLMVGIGIFNLPQFRSREGADPDGALVEPEVRAELGRSALDPADPLELDVDPRTQRVALGSSEHAADPAEEARDERPITTIAQAAAPSDERRAAAHLTHDTPQDQAAAAPDELAGALAVTDVAPSDGVGRVEDGPLPDVAASPEQPAIVMAPSAAPSAAPRAPSVPTARSTPSSPAYALDQVDPPSTSAALILPAAIHRQAQALATSGHCDQAVPRYRSLLAEHPDYADAPRAMIELAECDRRLGRLDDADRWLIRAESFPSVSADARRARVRIATEQRAVDHAGSSSSGASAAPDVRATTPPAAASSY